MEKRYKYYILYIFMLIIAINPVKVDAKNNILSVNTKRTNQFLVSIARPLCDESTYKRVFKICGSTINKDIRVRLYALNEVTNTYKPLKNTKGELFWDVGASGVFIKEAILPKEGVNKILVCAYDKKQEGNLRVGENLQINEFNITLLNSNIRDTVANRLFKISCLFRQPGIY